MSSTYRAALHSALVDEHRRVFDKNGRLRTELSVETDCPACMSSNSKVLLVKDGFRHLKCAGCCLVFISPRLNDEATFAFYNSPANEIYNRSKFHVESQATSMDDAYNLELLSWALHAIPSGEGPMALLEIGPARGTVMRAAERAGWMAYGVELNEANASTLSREFPGRVFRQDLLQLQLPAGKFDLILLRDVIEHIPQPIPFLQECHRLLTPGGHICIATHNIDGRIHDLVGLRHSVIFGFEHPVHWSPTSLTRALASAGFDAPDIRFGCENADLKYVISDLSLSTITGYFLNSPFTWIYPSWPSLRPAMRAVYKVINNRYVGLRNPWFLKRDSKYWLRKAESTGRESYFAALAMKSAE